MSSTEQQAAEEAFDQGFHGIPSPDARAKMSPEKLAIELSEQEKGSPPYILLEHELHMRLAKEQSKATLIAGRFGSFATIIAVFITAYLGSFAGASKPTEPSSVMSCPNTTCNCSYPVAPPLPAKNEKQTSKRADAKAKP